MSRPKFKYSFTLISSGETSNHSIGLMYYLALLSSYTAYYGGYFVVLGHEYVTVAIVHGEHREPQRSLIATREDSKALL